MALLTGYTHDIFVSYAHNDNQPMVSGTDGWVRTLVNLLRVRTVEKIGSNALDIWMDYELYGNSPVTPTITDALTGSAILLFIGSESYLASAWCQRELNAFLTGSVADRRSDALKRLFMISRDKIDRSRLPEPLRDLIGYKFWREDAGRPIPLGFPLPERNDTEYWSALNTISLEIADTLKTLQQGPTTPPQSGPIVHLAEVTEDLEPLRQDVAAYLKQAGINIVPNSYYPRDAIRSFQDAVERDLRNCTLFVQLLSAVPGRKPAELPQGFSGLQYQLAQVARKDILQWRNPNLNPNDVGDAELRKLLLGSTVVAEGFEVFKQRVKEHVLNPRPASPPVRLPHSQKLIFINTESGDRKIAERIANCVTRKGFGFVLSRETRVRNELRERLQECDGAIIIYASSPAKWVVRQQGYIRKILQELNPTPPTVAIYETQEEHPEFLDQRYFPTYYFDRNVTCEALDPFLEEVKKRCR
jgi:TIR domain